jgi:hypothetical protein
MNRLPSFQGALIRKRGQKRWHPFGREDEELNERMQNSDTRSLQRNRPRGSSMIPRVLCSSVTE